MAQRVFVNVAGFTGEERDALNLLFRASEGQETAYALRRGDVPEPAKVALIDGESGEAEAALGNPEYAEIPVLWVGPNAPERALRVFQRPIAWPEVLQALDEVFAGALDFDIDFDDADTRPPDTVPPDVPPRRRALIAARDRDERLYMRAKLALADLTQADEAENAAEALEMARMNDYVVALVDFDLPGAEGWKFVRELGRGQRPIGKIVVTSRRQSLVDRLRAWSSGVAGFFDKPPHPGKLHELLLRV